ncbi:MAG: GNAT family N-acetyltransferase [Nocardioidaceae bacterium]
MSPSPPYRLRLVRLTAETLTALLRGDLQAARELSGAALTPFFLDEAWLWRVRLDQLERDPESAGWFARAVVAEPEGVVVGHIGFHGPPDAVGMVEVGYSVDPAHRRRGYAAAMLAAVLDRAAADPAVRLVRASIAPDNEASLRTVARFGFVHTGEQWDDEDGLELVYEWDANRGVR